MSGDHSPDSDEALGTRDRLLRDAHLRARLGHRSRQPEAGGVAMAKIDAPEGVTADDLLREFMTGIKDYYAGGPRLRV